RGSARTVVAHVVPMPVTIGHCDARIVKRSCGCCAMPAARRARSVGARSIDATRELRGVREQRDECDSEWHVEPEGVLAVGSSRTEVELDVRGDADGDHHETVPAASGTTAEPHERHHAAYDRREAGAPAEPAGEVSARR